jgi:glycosyltransferase involved in cell wall biosynthesis
MPPRLSVILPVHNQGDHIAGVVAGHLEVLARVWHAPYEILLVTNGCSDNSLQVCAELAEREPAVRTIDLPVGGWGRAVRAGLAAADGDVLCYTNSARTTPEMVALMLAYTSA